MMNPRRGTAISLIIISTFCLTATSSVAQQSRQRDLKKVTAPASPNTSELFGESHALIFGASRYNNGVRPLPGVNGDVEAVEEVLRRHGFEVKVVMDPTQPKFDEEIRRFIGDHGLAKNNRLLIYFAGHGHTIGTEGYLVPVDAPHPDKDEAGFIKAAISFDEIQGYAKRIRSNYALFVFDSCFSGSLFDVRSTAAIPPPIVAIAGLVVRQFIASGSAKQTVPDKSIFRRQFVEALNGDADLPPRDGYITGTELGMYLHRTVTTYTANANGKPMQTPQYGKLRDPDYDKGDFIFISPSGSDAAANAQPVKSASISAPPKQEEASAATTGETGKWVEVESKTIPVQANQAWTDTLIQIKQGQYVRITGSGPQINLGRELGKAGPQGVFKDDPRKPAGACPTGALIAKIGSQIMCIGTEQKFTASSDGQLWLGINESNLADNFGAFTVKIFIQEFRQ